MNQLAPGTKYNKRQTKFVDVLRGRVVEGEYVGVGAGTLIGIRPEFVVGFSNRSRLYKLVLRSQRKTYSKLCLNTVLIRLNSFRFNSFSPES